MGGRSGKCYLPELGAACRFGYSTNEKQFTDINVHFVAEPGKWVGAKIGLFCTRNTKSMIPGMPILTGSASRPCNNRYL